MANGRTQKPPLLRRAIRVGVTGHRGLTGDHVVELRAKVREILGVVKGVLEQATDVPGFDTQTRPRLTLVTPLAAGADQLAAEEARGLGYGLHCPFPFFEEEYEKDFTPGSDEARRFKRLRDRGTPVLELDGGRATPEDEDRAYEAVGRLVLEQCDLLLAVWDGGPARGRGGTAQIVKEALDARIPVIVVPPEDPGRAEVRYRPRDGAPCHEPISGLPHHVKDLVFPHAAPEPADLAPRAGLDVLRAARAHHKAQHKGYAAFRSERAPEERLLVRLGLVAAWSGPWRVFQRIVSPQPKGPGAHAAEVVALPDAPGAPEGGTIASIRERFDVHYRWADGLALYYSGLYRSSFFMNYVLGAVAVTLAVLALLLGPGHGTGSWPLALAEAASVLTIAVVFYAGRRSRWHERAVNYRILAEQLRQMRFLAPLGLAVPHTRPPAHSREQADLHRTWMNWHFRAVLRDAGMVHARLTGAYLESCRAMLTREWVLGQHHYHERNEARNHRALRLCEWAALGSFGLALVGALGHLTGLSLPGLRHGFTVLAAIAPAWGAALHGIKGQGEFERLAERSKAMTGRLLELATILEDLPGTRTGITYRSLRDPARTASAEMLEEVNDWQVLYRIHGVPTA